MAGEAPAAGRAGLHSSGSVLAKSAGSVVATVQKGGISGPDLCQRRRDRESSADCNPATQLQSEAEGVGPSAEAPRASGAAGVRRRLGRSFLILQPHLAIEGCPSPTIVAAFGPHLVASSPARPVQQEASLLGGAREHQQQAAHLRHRQRDQLLPYCCPPFLAAAFASARVTSKKACAKRHRVTCRCQASQLLTSYWSPARLPPWLARSLPRCSTGPRPPEPTPPAASLRDRRPDSRLDPHGPPPNDALTTTVPTRVRSRTAGARAPTRRGEALCYLLLPSPSPTSLRAPRPRSPPLAAAPGRRHLRGPPTKDASAPPRARRTYLVPPAIGEA